MTKLSPEQILSNIRTWATEKGKFTTNHFDNPKAHFSEYILYHKPNTVIPIMVSYPKWDGKDKDKILVGWNWRPQEMDIKAYSAFKDSSRKEEIGIAIQNECNSRGLTIGVEPDIYNLQAIAIHRLIHINDFTKSSYINTILDLVYMWGFLMSQFEQHDMSRASFNPSDYI